MECKITHDHTVIFSPRNALAEEQAEITFNALQPIINARINKDYTTHISITWEEEVWIENGVKE